MRAWRALWSRNGPVRDEALAWNDADDLRFSDRTVTFTYSHYDRSVLRRQVNGLNAPFETPFPKCADEPANVVP